MISSHPAVAAAVLPTPRAADLAAASPAEIGPSTLHLAQIADARHRGKSIRRAAAIARFNGWTLALFAAVTLLTSVYSVWGIVVGLSLAGVSHFELRGGKELRRLDRQAPLRLALNQLALGAVLLAYAIAGIYSALHGPSAYSSELASDPAMAQMLGPIDSMTRSITALVYVVIAVVAIVVPTITAIYYLGRRRSIQIYLEHTPRWIVELQRMGSAI